MKACLQRELHTASAGHSVAVPFLIVLPICTGAVALMAICLTMGGTRDQRAHMCIAAGMGFIAWSLIEYCLHRFVLHSMWPFDKWHAAHHEGLFRTRQSIPMLAASVLIVILALIPAAMPDPSWPGIGASLGLLTGYGTYVAAHHAIHHLHCGCSWLMQRKFHHALHHDVHRRAGYYGVTTCFWDRLLGTRHPQEF